MHLYLSDTSPWNANYCNEAGQAIYKVESGGPTLGARRMMISKIAPADFDPQTEAVDESAFKDKFEHLAEVEYHTFKTSRIKYSGRDQSVKEIFRKEGWSFFGRNRIFNGPDGKEYCWELTSRVCKLSLNGTETPVAVFHRERLGFMKDARPGSLEIFPIGEHMVDFIVVTFVYLEKLRKDNERAAKY